MLYISLSYLSLSYPQGRGKPAGSPLVSHTPMADATPVVAFALAAAAAAAEKVAVAVHCSGVKHRWSVEEVAGSWAHSKRTEE